MIQPVTQQTAKITIVILVIHFVADDANQSDNHKWGSDYCEEICEDHFFTLQLFRFVVVILYDTDCVSSIK